MKPKISILMPAIRQERWSNLFLSIADSLESMDNFELILVSPYNLPEDLASIANIKLIVDYGSPTRCFNIALEAAEGELVTWGADDGKYLPGKLKQVIEKLETRNNKKHIIALSQMEDKHVYNKEFCRINKHHQLRSPFIQDDFVLFPTAVMHTNFMRSIGGLDCRFQGHAMAHIDFAIRAQTLGAVVEFENDICLHLSHMMGPSGDHGPIHYSQLQEDEPLFRTTYSVNNAERINKMATVENVANWKDQPSIWRWRFNNV
jgi:glycosyltransferase involved in cell wall biosynthesis